MAALPLPYLSALVVGAIAAATDVLGVLGPPLAAGRQDSRPAQALDVLDDDLGRLELIPGEPLWAAWVRRDGRLGMNQHSQVLADRGLSREDATPAERACAMYAIAGVAGRSARPFIEARIRAAVGVERRAAVLALGETGVGAKSILEELLTDRSAADCAILALARIDQKATDDIVLAIAGDAGNPLASVAEKLMVFTSTPEKSEPTAAGALFLNLRWHAARLYGEIDGQVWKVVVNRRLLEDRSFVRETILRSAGLLREPGAADHVLELLIEDTSPARLRAAVACIPRELSTLVRFQSEDTGGQFWKPANRLEWIVILDEISERGLEFETVELLVVASKVPEIRFRAAAMISRTGVAGLDLEFDGDFEGVSKRDRRWACEAMANTGSKRWLAVLEPLRNDDDVRVQAAALVAQYRLGSERARDDLADLLDGDDAGIRAALIQAMCAAVGDARVADWLERLLRRAEGEEALTIVTALAAQGRHDARSTLRELLRHEKPRGSRGAKIIRALAKSPTRDDIELLIGLYPRSDDREVNVALATALIELSSVEVLPLVRSAIWDEGWNLSILACGLLVERASLASLVDELSQPPAQATSEDIRRVGYALGEWGGIEEVSALARTLRYNSGHPALQGALLGALSTRTR